MYNPFLFVLNVSHDLVDMKIEEMWKMEIVGYLCSMRDQLLSKLAVWIWIDLKSALN